MPCNDLKLHPESTTTHQTATTMNNFIIKEKITDIDYNVTI